MGQKRKCRLNEQETAVHEMAVKLRKKTDEQLVEAFKQTYDQGYQNGLDKNKLPEGQVFVSEKVKLEFLANVRIAPGVGKSTYEKIEKLVQDLTKEGLMA
ncbi:MAG: hypothetical protein K0R00_3193 [Herbinix sp.]|jgi:hypothetical protein|nr:hypothetical protein [Herbinix sp.]